MVSCNSNTTGLVLSSQKNSANTLRQYLFLHIDPARVYYHIFTSLRGKSVEVNENINQAGVIIQPTSIFALASSLSLSSAISSTEMPSYGTSEAFILCISIKIMKCNCDSSDSPKKVWSVEAAFPGLVQQNYLTDPDSWESKNGDLAILDRTCTVAELIKYNGGRVQTW